MSTEAPRPASRPGADESAASAAPPRVRATGFQDATYERDESLPQRFDRNYSELLQELRVAQTGVQILFAFLLGIAFQQRFASISDAERVLYLITLISAAAAAVLLIGPVATHRILFGRRRKGAVVAITARLAAAGLVCLGIAILSALMFVLSFVGGVTLALICTISLGVVVLLVWLVVPLIVRSRGPH